MGFIFVFLPYPLGVVWDWYHGVVLEREDEPGTVFTDCTGTIQGRN